MSRRARVAGTFAVLGWLVAAAPASAGLADRVGATFALMAGDFVQAFKPVEGLVVSLDGDALYLDLGEGRGVQAGQEFTVFRKGEPFYHPLTHQRLGHYEEILGYAQVRQVRPQFSEATFISLSDKPLPRQGDGVRISRGRIKVAVTPLLDLTRSKADVRRVPYIIASTLERSRRFQVVDPLAVSDMFASAGIRIEEMLARPERALGISKNLEVAGWIVPVLLERRGVLYLDATWISAVSGTPLFARRRALVPEAAAEQQRFPWEPRPAD